MKKSYRETKNDLIHCPFNPNHLVKRSRLITHKKLCPDKNCRGIVQCPYNPSHHVLIENLEKHKEKCPDKVVINTDLANEMEAYIRSMKSGQVQKEIKKDKPNPTPQVEVTKEKENDKNNGNEIIGLEPKKKKNAKNNKNKKQKKVEEKLIDLENISNKELFNYMFNDKMCVEYDSDSSENDGERKDVKDNDDDDNEDDEVNPDQD